MSITVSAFYKFVTIAAPQAFRQEALEQASTHNIKGTILVAHEGINGTLSGAPDDMAAFLEWLRADARFSDLAVKTSHAEEHPFQRLKIKVKPEILTFGHPEADPSRTVGTYVAPTEWNALIEDPDVIVIDTRNAYEVDIGTFKNAVNPHTRAFRHFPDYVMQHLDPEKTPKVAMFCTGGIRCEKASSYLMSQGFSEVFHLEGGILKYLEQVPRAQSLWQGECFVFDERVAVEHGLQIGSYGLCEDCGYPIPKAEAEAAAADASLRCANCASSNAHKTC